MVYHSPIVVMSPPLIGGALSDAYVLMSDVCLSLCIAYIGRNSRTEA